MEWPSNFASGCTSGVRQTTPPATVVATREDKKNSQGNHRISSLQISPSPWYHPPPSALLRAKMRMYFLWGESGKKEGTNSGVTLQALQTNTSTQTQAHNHRKVRNHTITQSHYHTIEHNHTIAHSRTIAQPIHLHSANAPHHF